MKRWAAINVRRHFGKYTHDNAEEWEDWTRQWKQYQHGDPVSQMVRGTWNGGRRDA